MKLPVELTVQTSIIHWMRAFASLSLKILLVLRESISIANLQSLLWNLQLRVKSTCGSQYGHLHSLLKTTCPNTAVGM